MSYNFPFVTLNIRSLKNFQDENLAKSVLQLINTFHKEFIPDYFGSSEPLKMKYSVDNTEDAVGAWMNSHLNQENRGEGVQSGMLLMEKKRGSKSSYVFSWRKTQVPSFNGGNFSVNIEFLIKKGLDRYLEACQELIILLNPAQADITNESFPGALQPINLRKRHPELQWRVYFGEPYIHMFGREKLLATPCYKVEELSETCIMLQLTENVFEEIPEEVRKSVKEHLGTDAFVSGNKNIHTYKDGWVPNFDFSETLFDHNKPQEEHKILTREDVSRFNSK